MNGTNVLSVQALPLSSPTLLSLCPCSDVVKILLNVRGTGTLWHRLWPTAAMVPTSGHPAPSTRPRLQEHLAQLNPGERRAGVTTGKVRNGKQGISRER